MPYRLAIVLLGLAIWFLGSMWSVSGNTSWEHHPWGGPFILLKESLRERHTLNDWALALLLWSVALVFPFHWIITGKWWSAVVTLLLCGLSLMMSHAAAGWASC